MRPASNASFPDAAAFPVDTAASPELPPDASGFPFSDGRSPNLCPSSRLLPDASAFPPAGGRSPNLRPSSRPWFPAGIFASAASGELVSSAFRNVESITPSSSRGSITRASTGSGSSSFSRGMPALRKYSSLIFISGLKAFRFSSCCCFSRIFLPFLSFRSRSISRLRSSISLRYFFVSASS